ncbi:outer membrane beta-barrel protein [Larkinella rosea]|uniref:PorT family protein n=1 Tax=Larkinella rosea TaxID=2025312 RepID=A0A3P1C360_9BACT|nr:outer membrane beta-barrel protein [Larkinella rosea]RRB07830.1 PorT family protein [Larkinella rosea]
MKAFYYSLVLVMTTSTFAYSQGRFSLSATLSPTWRNLDYRMTIHDSSPDVSGANVLAKDHGGTVGLMANYQFHRNWSVSSGLWYNRSKGYMDFQAFRTNTTIEAEPTRQMTLNHLQLPVLINFSPTKNRLSPYLSTGLVFNMNYQSRISPFPGSNEAGVTHSKEINTHALVGVGVQYRISSRWSVIVQPTAMYRLGSLKNNSDHGYPLQIQSRNRDWQFGVQVRLKYTF